MVSSCSDRWFEAVTADDLALHGVDVFEGETPPQALMRLAEEMDVDVAAVGRCLDLLQHEPCVLAGGAPMALLACSTRRGVFHASFDAERADDLANLSLASAGVWLTLLAVEVGELPVTAGHWLIARVSPGVSAINPDVMMLAQDYARFVVYGASQADMLNPYHQQLGQAFWRCVAHRLR